QGPHPARPAAVRLPRRQEAGRRGAAFADRSLLRYNPMSPPSNARRHVETSVLPPLHTLDLTSFPVLEGVRALVIVGRGGPPPLVHALFFHLAGGPNARVLHLPSATITFEDIPDKREYYCHFYDRKPASFEFLHTYDRAVAERPEFARPLREATGVWIGGGAPARPSGLFPGAAGPAPPPPPPAPGRGAPRARPPPAPTLPARL